MGRRTAPWVQLRRITCACGEPFVFLARGTAVAYGRLTMLMARSSASDPLVAEGLEERLRTEFRRAEAAKRIGRARCPHCGIYQRWMTVSARSLREAFRGGFWGLGVGFAALVATSSAIPHAHPALTLGALLGPAVLGVPIGFALTLRGRIPAGEDDPAALTLDEFGALRQEAVGKQLPVESLWLARVERARGAPTDAEVLSPRLAEDGGFE